MKAIFRLGYSALLVVTITLAAGIASADSLWLGNDSAPPAQWVTTTGAPLGSIDENVTGFAWDGTFLYSSSSTGDIRKRQLDGTFVSDLGFVANNGLSEDMAFDTSRNRLWRVDHIGFLRKINPITGADEADYALPTADPNNLLTPLGALGIAYDSKRDQLYVSFCRQGCSSSFSEVLAFNPNDGSYIGSLFYTDYFAGGLGYDANTDTLWMGGAEVRNLTLGGATLSGFANPTPFSDGLEFIPSAVPEPGSIALLFTAIAGLAAMRLKQRRA